ncbi:hypothetical protein BAY61_31985 (plasmid) [Prauserella marina]|nr:hypothetical protein BAY61_31985 [Prauserella marina]
MLGPPSELSHFHASGDQIVTLHPHELTETLVRALLHEAEQGRITIPAATFLATEQHTEAEITFRRMNSAP